MLLNGTGISERKKIMFYLWFYDLLIESYVIPYDFSIDTQRIENMLIANKIKGFWHNWYVWTSF